jgi:hypothetical protein
METDSSRTVEKRAPKVRWYQYRLRALLLVLTIIAIGFCLSLLCGLELTGEYSVSVAVVVIASVVCVGYCGLRWAERRFQYSLRSLFLLTLLVAIGMSYIAVTVQDQRRQHEAVKAIRKIGGWANSEPTWLGRLLRDDSLVNVAEARLSGTAVTDAELESLRGLSQLRRLDLSGTDVTDAGLVYLETLSQLRWLALRNTRVTDAGLMHLQGLHRLQSLQLGGTRVTDAGLAHLEKLGQLRTLELDSTKVTDAGLVHIQKLSQLQSLNLDSTKVTDGGLARFQRLANPPWQARLDTKQLRRFFGEDPEEGESREPSGE